VTDGKFFIAQIMFFINKKSKKVKISEKKISFFSTLNQYFPHISYVASKNVKNSAMSVWVEAAELKFCMNMF
jgi:hypothetical protein